MEIIKMYRAVNRFSVLKRIVDDSIFLSPNKVNGLETIRTYKGDKQTFEATEAATEIIPFQSLLTQRHDQAKRSIIVQVLSQESSNDLVSYCEKFGKVKYNKYYSNSMNYVLIEMENEDQAQDIMKNATCGRNCIPLSSHFLWFKKDDEHINQLACNKITKASTSNTETKVDHILNNGTMSDEIELYYENTKLDDIGYRLRLLTLLQIEVGLRQMFKVFKIYPFGSCINGFGMVGSDADGVLLLQSTGHNKNSRLFSQSKLINLSHRSELLKLLRLTGSVFELLIPGCSGITCITARVPIVKFKQDVTNIECDISFHQSDSIVMSELLYTLGELDKRVRPLVFAIRYWTKVCRLNELRPSCITSFQLILMVTYYLQSKQILPPLHKLNLGQEILTPKLYLEMIRNVKNDLNAPPNTLEELFISFFYFYNKFDFSRYAINLITADIVRKPLRDPLYIVNPLDPDLNAAASVSEVSLRQFIYGVAYTTSVFESIISTSKKLKFSEILEHCSLQSDSWKKKKVKLNFDSLFGM